MQRLSFRISSPPCFLNSKHNIDFAFASSLVSQCGSQWQVRARHNACLTASAHSALLLLMKTPHVKKSGKRYSVLLHQTRSLCILKHLHMGLREPESLDKIKTQRRVARSWLWKLSSVLSPICKSAFNSYPVYWVVS